MVGGREEMGFVWNVGVVRGGRWERLVGSKKSWTGENGDSEGERSDV